MLRAAARQASRPPRAAAFLCEGVHRSLYSGEGVSAVLSDADVRRVLCGRPVASEWSVDAVFRSFESSCQLPR